MGYRVHYAQHYAPEWKGGYFNWNIEQWNDLFFARFSEGGWKDEHSDIYEVFRGDVEAYVKELKELKPEDKNEYFPDVAGEPNSGYTNQEIINILEEILTSDDEYIRLECF